MWQDPANWRGPRWFPVYTCERDARLLVPKKNPTLGWTLNFAHQPSWWGLWAMMTVPSLLVMVGLWFFVRPSSGEAMLIILLLMVPPLLILGLCRWALTVPGGRPG